MRKYAALIAALIVFGCSPKTKVARNPDWPNGKPDTNSNAAVEPTNAAIPKELLTDGFRALGAPFEKPIGYKVSGTGVVPSEGKRTVKISATKDGIKVDLDYGVMMGGQPAGESYSASSKGIYTLKAQGSEIIPPPLFLPARIKLGDSWKSTCTLDNPQNGQKLTLTTSTKILRKEPVTVPLGSFDALVVSESGTLTGKGIKVKTNGTSWFVDGVGMVKTVQSFTNSAGPGGPQKFAITMTAIAPPNK